MPDIIFENHLSLFLARPATKAGREWLEASTSDEAQWFGNALAIEPRYVNDIALGAHEDGLEVSLA